jgi:hypothetical protein
MVQLSAEAPWCAVPVTLRRAAKAAVKRVMSSAVMVVAY